MKTGTTEGTPLRAGVFATVPEADRAMHRLLGAGFFLEQITVLCSDASKKKLFHEFRTSGQSDGASGHGRRQS